MTPADLVFVGIKGSVVALNRISGEQVWATHLKGSDFVNVVLDNGRLFATTAGEIFCLDPATGSGQWHNRLKGFGLGLASIALENNLLAGLTVAMAAQRQRQQAAAAASAG
jgi:outer membrane protein assembly factor BamB